MARQKKVNIEEIDIEHVAFLVKDAYGEICQERDASDFGGHDYAYKVGYLKSSLESMMRDLGIN